MALDFAFRLTVLFVAAALVVVAALAVLNTLTFPRLGRRSAAAGAPLISVCIPARNEAAVIGQTVRALLAQTGVSFEVLLLDDNSDDDTASTAHAAAAGDSRLRVFEGEVLPAGWFGKNWACAQLARQARGELLLFTDADVRWGPGALAALAAEQAASGAGLVSAWPTQITRTWGERLVVPLMALVIYGYLPLPLVNRTRWAPFAAANGQCLLFTRAAYAAAGGHAAVRASIVEDIDLARRVKRAGETLWMADGAGQIACRMYTSWPQVRDGYAKNIIAGYGGLLPFALGALFHWLVFFGPWLWLLGGLAWPALRAPFAFPVLPLALIALGILVRALTAAATRQRPADALLMPVSVALMTVIAARALYWQVRYGGPRWKGRTLTRRAAGEAPASS
jgi:chlorobactene glucosyltransferase